MRVAIASCRRIPEVDHDEAPLLAALHAAQIDAQVLAWDDASAPFAEHDMVLLRSTWNYYQRVDDFVAWVERTGAKTEVLNPPHIVSWNVKKTYLTQLEARGVSVVPTELVVKGTTRDVGALLASRGWNEVVIKPVVSAGSFRTERFAVTDTPGAQAFLDELVTSRDAMVQQWMPSVVTYGERSLVWIDGEITHAIRKTPRFSGGVEQVSGGVAIADDERAFAERALAPFASDLLYARVDMVRDVDGTLRIMELELVEPSLFFVQAPHALERFVAAVVRRVRRLQHAKQAR